jgi:hypothetical protein
MCADIEKNIPWAETVSDPAEDMRLGESAIQKLGVCPYRPAQKHLGNRQPGARQAMLEKLMQSRNVLLEQ